MSGRQRAVTLKVGERVEVDSRAFTYLGGYDAGEGDAGLRLAGALLLSLAWLAFGQLERRYGAGPHAPSAMDFAWATIGFLSASVGAALAICGNRIFDRVTVSQRWARGRPSRARPDSR